MCIIIHCIKKSTKFHCFTWGRWTGGLSLCNRTGWFICAFFLWFHPFKGNVCDLLMGSLFVIKNPCASKTLPIYCHLTPITCTEDVKLLNLTWINDNQSHNSCSFVSIWFAYWILNGALVTLGFLSLCKNRLGPFLCTTKFVKMILKSNWVDRKQWICGWKSNEIL